MQEREGKPMHLRLTTISLLLLAGCPSEDEAANGEATGGLLCDDADDGTTTCGTDENGNGALDEAEVACSDNDPAETGRRTMTGRRR